VEPPVPLRKAFLDCLEAESAKDWCRTDNEIALAEKDCVEAWEIFEKMLRDPAGKA